jgi:integrase/recombinase XerD
MLAGRASQVVDHPCINHWQVGTTMRYVTPSATFIEDAYRRAVSDTLGKLEEGDDGH